MNTKNPMGWFWTVLTVLNVLLLTYPIHLLRHANSVDENLFATWVVVGSLFLLASVNAVGIVVVDRAGIGRPKRTGTRESVNRTSFR